MRMNSLRIFFSAALLCAAASHSARAHPLSQGRMELVIYRDKIILWASVSVEQVVVQQSLPVGDDGLITTQADAYRAHGAYFLKHIFLSADGKPLVGKVVAVQDPDSKSIFPLDMGKEFATYEIEFPLAVLPAELELHQDVLNEVEFTPNNPWQATYITGIHHDQTIGQENLLLSSTNTLKFACDWSAPAAPAPATTEPKSPEKPAAPPENLKRPLPEQTSHRTQFVAGIAIGICVIYLLAMLVKKLRH